MENKKPQTVFEQLSKEMAVFSQNNSGDYNALREFFLYELKLRCICKSEFRELANNIQADSDDVKEKFVELKKLIKKECEENDDGEVE